MRSFIVLCVKSNRAMCVLTSKFLCAHTEVFVCSHRSVNELVAQYRFPYINAKLPKSLFSEIFILLFCLKFMLQFANERGNAERGQLKL